MNKPLYSQPEAGRWLCIEGASSALLQHGVLIQYNWVRMVWTHSSSFRDASTCFIVQLLLSAFSNPFYVVIFVPCPCSGNMRKKAEFDHIHEDVRRLDFIGLEAY